MKLVAQPEATQNGESFTKNLLAVLIRSLRSAALRSFAATAVVALAIAWAGALTVKAATFTVTTNNDSGAGSLRQAIINANASPGADTINFNIPGAGVHSLSPLTPWPVISDPVTIDGYSQPGASVNTLAKGDNAVLLIELTGANPFSSSEGLVISAGSSTVRGLIVNGFNTMFANGIKLITKGGNVISGNFIGMNSSATVKVPNYCGLFVNGSANNVIGGISAAARNVISGNAYGIGIQNLPSTGNSVSGNFIGTDRNGTAALGNGTGIFVASVGQASSDIEIGGTSPGAGNVISGNDTGVGVTGTAAGVLIQGNLIGTDVTGKVGLGNSVLGISIYATGNTNVIGGPSPAARNIISANGDGIDLYSGSGTIVQGNYIGTDITGKVALGNKMGGLYIASSFGTIGGGGAGEGNVISANGSFGIKITHGAKGNFVNRNLIGWGSDGTTALGNGEDGIQIYDGSENIIGGSTAGTNAIANNARWGIVLLKGTGNLISSNSISSNGQLGIDLDALGVLGVTPNDPGDGDTGANNLQNYPVVTAASLINNGLTYIDGTLNSAANTKFTVELFANGSPDPTGFGEGQVFLGATTVTTDSNGNGNFTTAFAGLSAGKCISATAIDPALNTSEFSQCTLISPNSPGSLQFSSAAYSVNENGAQATITVKRSGGNFGTVTLQYATAAGGTATAGSDYTSAAGLLSWAHGDSTDKSFTIPMVDDSVAEPNETVNLAVSNPTNGATLGSPASSVLTIVDDETAPKISITDVSQAEGNSGTANFTLNVTLSAASSQTVTVNYTTADNTAQTGSDYQATNGVLTFAPGETSKTVSVTVNGDNQVEPNETFAVNLYNLINAGVGKVTGVGTIVNDDNMPAPTLQFGASDYSVQEDLGALTITVTRSGDASLPASVDYLTVDGTATQKGDFEYGAGRLVFAPGETSKTFPVLINEDMYTDGPETFTVTLSNPTGASLGAIATTTVGIIDDSPESPTNPIDDAQSFVYTHYHDFLNREPDAAGLAFWTSEITSCGADARCIETKRNNVAAAFFLSIEFQQTGYLRYLIEKESFGSMPKYASFMRDLQEVGRGVVVGEPGWEQKLSGNQQQFVEEWINRPEFKAVFDGMSNDDFVNALYANAGIAPAQAKRDSLVTALDAATASRAQVLLDVAGDASFRQQQQNAAFVMMQYFGYLRRDPDAAPDSDLSGYDFWLNKLNQFNGNYLDAEMVKAFIISSEYRQRFGP